MEFSVVIPTRTKHYAVWSGLDTLTWWAHYMRTLSVPFVRGIHRWLVDCPVSFFGVSCWTNNWVVGDMRLQDDYLVDRHCKVQHLPHYSDVIMGAMASQITSLMIVYSTICSDADQRKHQSSASLAFVRGIHRWPLNSPHKWPVTRKCFHLMTSSWVVSAATTRMGRLSYRIL